MKTESRNLIIALLLGAGAVLFMGQSSRFSGRYQGVALASGSVAVIDTESGAVKIMDNAASIGKPFMEIYSDTQHQEAQRRLR
jgi:hypothetical protein